MTDFDPYAAWLDIPPHHQPPQPWRLLAVTPDCRDPVMLRAAAERAEQRVRLSATPEHGAWVERLCVEIRAAERTILGGHSMGEQPLAPPTPMRTSVPSSAPKRPPLIAAPPPAGANSGHPASGRQTASNNVESPLSPPGAASPAPISQPIQAPPSPVMPSGETPAGPTAYSNADQPIIARPVGPTANEVAPANRVAPGPLPLGPPTHPPVSDAPSGQSLNMEGIAADELGEPQFPEFDGQFDRPSLVVIAAISISCFLVGVVVMLIFILLR